MTTAAATAMESLSPHSSEREDRESISFADRLSNARDSLVQATSEAMERLGNLAKTVALDAAKKYTAPVVDILARFNDGAERLRGRFTLEFERREFDDLAGFNSRVMNLLEQQGEKGVVRFVPEDKEGQKVISELIDGLSRLHGRHDFIYYTNEDVRELREKYLASIVNMANQNPEAGRVLNERLAAMALDLEGPVERRLLAIEAMDRIAVDQGERVDLEPLLDVYAAYINAKPRVSGARIIGDPTDQFELLLRQKITFRAFELRGRFSQDADLMSSSAQIVRHTLGAARLDEYNHWLGGLASYLTSGDIAPEMEDLRVEYLRRA